MVFIPGLERLKVMIFIITVNNSIIWEDQEFLNLENSMKKVVGIILGKVIFYLEGNLFRETLQKSITSSVDFIQLITWNDWGEGTAIEPSVEYQFEPLSIIQEFIGVPFKKEDLDLSISLYLKRKEYKNNSLVNKNLIRYFII